jgi:hypothetical protein
MSMIPGLQVGVDMLTKWVQSWVHYDNLASAHSRQATNARKLRDEQEDSIIKTLAGTPNEKMIIQIHSGRLQIVEDRYIQPLTLGRLEEFLGEYFTSRQRSPTLDTPEKETTAVMKFIREHRSTQVSKKLKKSSNASQPTLPPLPPPGTSGQKQLPK